MSVHLVLLHSVDHICLYEPSPTDLVHVPSALQMAVWTFSLSGKTHTLETHPSLRPASLMIPMCAISLRRYDQDAHATSMCHHYLRTYLLVARVARYSLQSLFQ